MIPVAKEKAIVELLDEGLSQREIARIVGVCRGIVGAIATGKRPADESARRALRRQRRQAERAPGSGSRGRCPECGANVLLPCIACQARQAKRRSPRNRPEDSEEGLALDLLAEDQARYQRLHEAKLQEAGATEPRAGEPLLGRILRFFGWVPAEPRSPTESQETTGPASKPR